MKFCEQLNRYLEELDCTAKELGEAAGLSDATVSRYRTGERVPELNSAAFKQLCSGLAILARQHGLTENAPEQIAAQFKNCTDLQVTDKLRLCESFNLLVLTLNLNISRLCRFINYDTSTVFRIRNGTRRPADPVRFASDVAQYIAQEPLAEAEIAALAELTASPAEKLLKGAERFERVKAFLLRGNGSAAVPDVSGFLKKLNEFNLNEFIEAIHFNEMKVPTLPFALPTSKTYIGLKEMMNADLDFLKATVLSRATEPVIMYSDMPMEEMAKDPEFPKKWMFGMAMMLKKGLHLNMIHNVDRPIAEMMLGLESYIPMYMTGQITPYYLKGVQNNAFLHLLKVSGAAALSGEAIAGHHAEGRYLLTKHKGEVAYYQKRANALLQNAYPLMEIYRADNAVRLNAFLLGAATAGESQKSILCAPPIYTASPELLRAVLTQNGVNKAEQQSILNYAAARREQFLKQLQTAVITNEVPAPNPEDFKQSPPVLALAGLFYEKDVFYTYEAYKEHFEQTLQLAKSHANYRVIPLKSRVFKNLQIHLKPGKWAMVSKNKAPAIHFVIHHPKLRAAIESFQPPLVES